MSRQIANLGGLSPTDKGSWIYVPQALLDTAGDFGTGALRQSRKFGQRIIDLDIIVRAAFDSDQNRALAAI